MTPDELAVIIRNAFWAQDEVFEQADKALDALVEIAKAARDHRCDNHMKLKRSTGEVYCSICKALARLDSGSKPESAPQD